MNKITRLLILILCISTIFTGCKNIDEVVNDKGDTQLMESIRHSGDKYTKHAEYVNERTLVFELIEKGADINFRNKYDETPLILAVDEGDLEIVEALLGKNADINVQRKAKINLSNKPNYSHDGNTVLFSALVLAVKGEGLEMLKYLLENNAKPNIKNKEGETVLHWAAKYDQLECAKLLINYGADINAIDNEGNTPLIHASNNFLSKNQDIIDFLIEEGADITIKNNKDKDYAYYIKEYEEYQKKIGKGKNKQTQVKENPRIGMTAEEVEKSTWGKPKKINRTTTKHGVSEQWVYELGKYIYLNNDIVTAIQDFD